MLFNVQALLTLLSRRPFDDSTSLYLCDKISVRQNVFFVKMYFLALESDVFDEVCVRQKVLSFAVCAIML